MSKQQASEPTPLPPPSATLPFCACTNSSTLAFLPQGGGCAVQEAQEQGPGPPRPPMPHSTWTAVPAAFQSSSPDPGWGAEVAFGHAGTAAGPPQGGTAVPLPSPGTRTWACSTPSQELESRHCPPGSGCAHRWQSPGGCSRHSHGLRVSAALRKPQEGSFQPAHCRGSPRRCHVQWVGGGGASRSGMPLPMLRPIVSGAARGIISSLVI